MTPKQPKRRLVNLRLKRIDIVDAGDNPGANILLYKARENDETEIAFRKGGSNMTAVDEAQAIEKRLRAADPKLTRLQAHDRAWTPELYKRHIEERGEARPAPVKKAAIVPGSTPTWLAVVAAAKKLVDQGDGTLTLVQAIRQVWESDASLWAKHQNERRAAALAG